jgi:hypothetical protein
VTFGTFAFGTSGFDTGHVVPYLLIKSPLGDEVLEVEVGHVLTVSSALPELVGLLGDLATAGIAQ